MQPDVVEVWWCEAEVRRPLAKVHWPNPATRDVHMADQATLTMARIGQGSLPRW